jgi:hypothetical protein
MRVSEVATGLSDIALHVMGRRPTQETKIQIMLKDILSNFWQALPPEPPASTPLSAHPGVTAWQLDA